MKHHHLSDTYQFPGFRVQAHIKGVFGEPGARIVRLERTGKKLPAVPVGVSAGVSMIRKLDGYVIWPVGMPGFILNLNPEGSFVRHVEK